MAVSTRVTVADVERALQDERHLGWGYSTKYYLPRTRQENLDRAVASVASELDLDSEALFAWTNAKSGRWLVDAATAGRINRDLVRKFLNAEAVAEALDTEVGA